MSSNQSNASSFPTSPEQRPATTPLTIPSGSSSGWHSRKRTQDEEISTNDFDLNLHHLQDARTPDWSPATLQNDEIPDMASVYASTSGPSLHPDPTNENLGSALAYRLADNVTPTVVRAPVSAVLDEAGRIAARQRFVSPPPLSQFSNAAPEASASAMQTELPFIDDATRVLGIGWTAIYDLAKADDSARTIDMNYLVREPKIIAENENLDFQLVQASSGFWLFQEEFGSARFISTTFEDVIIRLQRDPIDFMDAQPLRRISIRDLDLSDPQVVDYFERREASMANTRRASDPPVPDVVGAGYFERSTWREASMANTRRASDARTVDWSEVAEMHPILRTNLHSSGMANASQIDWDALASEAVESEAVESEKSGEGGEEGEERRGE